MECPICGADILEGDCNCPICGFEILSDTEQTSSPYRTNLWSIVLKFAMTLGSILALFEIFRLVIGETYSMPVLILGLGLLLVGYIAMRVFHVDV